MTSPSLVVAFRTHIWNKDIEAIARRTYSSTTKAHFVIIADETRGELDVYPFQKIGHTSEFSSFDIFNYPEDRVLWYNGDYPLYVLLSHFPECSHFIMVENDVSINFDIDTIIKNITEQHIDFIAHKIEESTPEWLWHETTAAWFDSPKKCLFPFIYLSKKAINALLDKRRDCARKVNDATMPLEMWPYCEGFIPSTLCSTEGMNIAELSSFVSTRYYDFDWPHYYKSKEATIEGTICHPALGHQNFLKRRLAWDGLSSIFYDGSIVRREILAMTPGQFYPVFLEAAQRSGDVQNCIRLNELALKEHWIMKPEAINWALGGKATQSSISAYSHSSIPEEDAAFGVNGIVDQEYGFHTEEENNPWWMVELTKTITIRNIIVYNRAQYQERASKISIEVSEDKICWKTVFSAPQGVFFGGTDGYPLAVKVDAVPARFVKIFLQDHNVLHLNQIEVYDQ